MKRFMRKIHKYLGLAPVVVFILVSVTGVLLIHKKSLGLNGVLVNVSGYGGVPSAVDAFDILLTDGGIAVAATKQGVYVYDAGTWKVAVPVPAKRLYVKDGTLYACAKDGLYASAEGKTWRRLFSGHEVKALLFNEGSLFIATSKGVYRSDKPEKGKWETVISFPRNAPDVRNLMYDGRQVVMAAKEGVFAAGKGGAILPEGLPVTKKQNGNTDLQKIITDLHTGEFFGRYFYLVMDAVAIGLVIVSLSGIYIWYLPKKRRTIKEEGRSERIS
ncbi:MAG: PepSY domain-containing protein [Alphaproteobacteria bacterium]|uniref:PepSY domain-containing protein n=1 Tax=Candidatus Nitrobium versatile TaxID=2884831 RepID=A0A953M245_9BACT|nr:PepSY domain-containing protein [Candidatus Nitrobium versatile]